MTVALQSKNTRRVSTADAPDLDWSQVTETVRMLNLSVAQIAMAMQDSEDSVSALAGSFTNMTGNIEQIVDTASALDDASPTKTQILQDCSSVQSGIQQSIIAFQFYDRLSQRIDHVKQALEQLSGLVSDQGRLYNPEEWQKLQQGIRGRYSMREEQEMFDILAAGASVEEALQVVRQCLNDGDINDIELF